jgi:hypothetical protein
VANERDSKKEMSGGGTTSLSRGRGIGGWSVGTPPSGPVGAPPLGGVTTGAARGGGDTSFSTLLTLNAFTAPLPANARVNGCALPANAAGSVPWTFARHAVPSTFSEADQAFGFFFFEAFDVETLVDALSLPAQAAFAFAFAGTGKETSRTNCTCAPTVVTEVTCAVGFTFAGAA